MCAAEVRFQRVCLQSQKCSFPAQNIRLQCDIIFMEVSSRDYLIASDTRVHLLFGSWPRNPPKEQKVGKELSAKHHLK